MQRRVLIAVCAAAVAGGSALGWGMRRILDEGAAGASPLVSAVRRGSGELVVEYFDPACEASRRLHAILEEALAGRRFEHAMVPVAIGRSREPAFADALCAAPAAEAWRLAAAWAKAPPRREDLAGLDEAALRRCAAPVEAATRAIARLPGGGGAITTPVVELRGRVYRGIESAEALVAALAAAR